MSWGEVIALWLVLTLTTALMLWLPFVLWAEDFGVVLFCGAVWLPLALFITLELLRNGTIEVTESTIAYDTIWGRYEIKWEEVEYIGRGRANLHFGNSHKELVLPNPGRWSGKNAETLFAYMDIQIEERKIPVREIQKFGWWSKNARVAPSKK